MDKQITYTGMIWLLCAQVVVMLPFALQLPMWLLPVLLFAAGWRLWVILGKATQPSTVTKLMLIGLGLWGLGLSGLRFPSLDAMAALLLLGFAFKSLEVIEKRDALVVIFIGYFLVALQFLYDQSMLAALYGVFALSVLTAALIGIQQTVSAFSSAQQVRFNLRLAFVMLLQCLPLMVVIFLFTPRLPPLWHLPLPSGQAKSGISERMAPGDIARLSQSAELAFRVSFEGARPAQSELYWRGLVLNHFDGREWQQFAEDYELRHLQAVIKQNYSFQPQRLEQQGTAVRYEAVYEKTGQAWLFTLTPAVEVDGDVLQVADYRIMAQQPLQAPFLLKATSYPQSRRDLQLDPLMRQLALQLPPQGDQQARQLAQRLWQQANGAESYVNKVLAYFQQQGFYYTLRPPLLGDSNTIDNFLFEAQRGFCAHYAGSFVFLMRAAGIPARVVTGYQGGEWNEQGQYLAIHQYDAHAWTEVWLQGQGWVRVDPTTVVAPERASQGLETAMQAEGSFLEDSWFSVRKLPWLNELRQQFDSVQYGWRRWVLGYDSDTQLQLLRQWLGELSIAKVASFAGSFLVVIVLLWLVLLGLTQRAPKMAAEQRIYQTFCHKLAKRGVRREKGQTPRGFAQQAIQVLPQQATQIEAFTRLYEDLCYAEVGSRAAVLRQLQHLVRKL